MKKISLVKYFFMVLISVSVFALQSCKTEGCTDPDSVNYNVEADIDDHSCLYEGSVVFWYNEATANNLMAADAQSLTLYVDGSVIGSYATNVYFSSSPDCTAQSVVTVTKDLGSAKSKSYSYKVIDDDDYTWWEGNINVDANTCLAFELTWSKCLKK